MAALRRTQARLDVRDDGLGEELTEFCPERRFSEVAPNPDVLTTLVDLPAVLAELGPANTG